MPIFDVLAVAIAFVAVMALLSLIVTALVQLTAHVFGMRGRNLKWGIQRTLVDALGESESDAAKTAANAIRANRFLPQADTPAADAGNLLETVWRSLTNPLVTWVEPDQLGELLTSAGVKGITAAKRRKLEKRFGQLDGYLRKRFAFHARFWTIVWAAFIAFYFQLSTPQLLNRLATDPQLREGLVAEAETLAGQAEAIRQRVPSYEDVATEALTTLIQRHPKLASRLRQAAAAGDSREYLIQELELVLADVPEQRDAIVTEYGQLLDQGHEAAVNQAVGEISFATGRLAEFEIEPWKEGWPFYAKPENLFGVAITAILLSFGAPFWFEWLGKLLKLRDVLSPQEETEQDEKDQKKPAKKRGVKSKAL